MFFLVCLLLLFFFVLFYCFFFFFFFVVVFVFVCLFVFSPNQKTPISHSQTQLFCNSSLANKKRNASTENLGPKYTRVWDVGRTYVNGVNSYFIQFVLKSIRSHFGQLVLIFRSTRTHQYFIRWIFPYLIWVFVVCSCRKVHFSHCG